MRSLGLSTRVGTLIVALAASSAFAAREDGPPTVDEAATTEQAAAAGEPRAPYKTESLRGKVVWMSAALERRFGVNVDADASESLAALETAEGELHPLVKDFRGRAFHLDPRLRDVEVELLVRRFAGSPLVQVVRVYSIKRGRKHELDYWCDVCAIPMYELKACECCQGPTRIRERPVEESGAAASE